MSSKVFRYSYQSPSKVCTCYFIYILSTFISLSLSPSWHVSHQILLSVATHLTSTTCICSTASRTVQALLSPSLWSNNSRAFHPFVALTIPQANYKNLLSSIQLLSSSFFFTYKRNPFYSFKASFLYPNLTFFLLLHLLLQLHNPF